MEPEKMIQMASKLYDARRTAKHLFGDNWKVHIDPFKKIILREMKAADTEITTAIHLAAKEASIHPMVSICFMAAAVELVEPE